jgi:hypothetical protein
MLAYLMRREPQRALPLLEAALPASAEQFDFSLTNAMCAAYYSKGLDAFLRERLATGPAGQAGWAAFYMSQHGPTEDQEVLRQRLDCWRAQWAGKDIPLEEGKPEGELVQRLIKGKEWQMADTEASVMWESCISPACRSRSRAHP